MSAQLPNSSRYFLVRVLQYTELCKAVSRVEKTLRCVYLQWATEVEMYMTLNIVQRLNNSDVEIGSWFWLVPFSPIVGTAQILRPNIAIHPFSAGLLKPPYRF